MRPLPTLRQLRYLVTVVELRHFGQAAEACFVTQSTLSAGIQELEDILGVVLIERTRRKVLPTPLGLELAERARRVLREVEDMAELAQASRQPLTGEIRLGVIPTVGPFLLPKVLPALRETYPQLKLFLREEQTARLLDQLSAGDIDLALLALPYDAPDAEFMTVGHDRFLVALPKTHPLARAGHIAPEDLDVQDMLLLEEGHCLREHALSACHLVADRNAQAIQGTSLYTLVQMVASGLGITFLPEMALDSDILKGVDVALRPLSDEHAGRGIGLAWRRSSGRKAEFRLLGEFLRTQLDYRNAKVITP
ncbi:hydrogen peroxide-inducible genes activator [Telmatospirillum sp. J64-1]|uniref:hydrogen peroxide-inducible genes activator n=1 Tax=Telmatospirillum sp. J64-1 TaxID=2502183 RepID=UPI00115E7500|nr:hydrogen peroxide-inducible genes activator [Telmatospirillum sp. J64-1]